ncbi:MAG: hypothetical protein ACRDZX_10735 [Acidimicrobiales bacterium]
MPTGGGRAEGQGQLGAGPPAISRGHDRLRLLSQTPWVGPGPSRFELDLDVTASDPTSEGLAVSVDGPLTSRSQFQLAMAGHPQTQPVFNPAPVPLPALRRGDRGGAEVDIPVNTQGAQPAADTYSEGLSLSGTGIYPVQVYLEKEGVTVGKVLTTFLVFAGPVASHLQPLNVGLVVPFSAGVPINLDGSSGSVPPGRAMALGADSAAVAHYAALAHDPVRVTLEPGVATVRSLADGPPQQRRAVEAISAAVGSGDQLLPATAYPVDLPALVGSGLTSWVRAEVTTGVSELRGLLGAAPAPAMWALPSGVDPATAAALSGMGARQLVVPAQELSPPPPRYQELTFAWPTELDAGGSQLRVIGADTELSYRVSQRGRLGQSALAANQVLAELAMVDLEQPANTRGVVLLPRAGTVLGPTFLSVLLAGLRGNPLLRATTLAGQFKAVHLASSSTGNPLVRSLQGPTRAGPIRGISRLGEASSAVLAAGRVFPTSPTVRSLGQRLFVSLSSALGASRRGAVVSGVLRAAGSELNEVRLPPRASITLTSRRAHLPLTLLSKAGVPAHVRLVLSSENLRFVGQRFPQGRCHPLSPGSDSCELELTSRSTALAIGVITAPGVFPLSLVLESPGGDVRLGASTDTVRSTAVPYVGLFVMIGAALFLAVWWARNARHGRRARQLVPRPTDDDAAGHAGTGGMPGGLEAGEAEPAPLGRAGW